ncbi:Ubiquitinyl hydrolase 1 [Bertholletia excelsa]
MLEPRETGLSFLFLVLVVLPLFIYILLGKWSETTKKKERIDLLAQLAAEEAFRAESMAAASVILPVPDVKNGIYVCARCSGPATTRCSRCKSVRYCSGKCQIIHWRQFHKHECQQLESNSFSSSHVGALNEESICGKHFPSHRTKADCIETSGVQEERRSTEHRVFCKLRREDDAISAPTEEAVSSRISHSSTSSSNPDTRHKLENRDSVPLGEEIHTKHEADIFGGSGSGHIATNAMHENHQLQNQQESISHSRTKFGISSSLNFCDPETDLMSARDNYLREGSALKDEMIGSNYSSEMTSVKRSTKAKSASQASGMKKHKSQKSMIKVSKEHLCSEMEGKGQFTNESEVGRLRDTVPAQGSNGATGMGFMKMIGLRKSSKLGKQESSEAAGGERHKKLKMIFPYDEFVKCFQYEAFDLSPRGLVNCGNSCYANAVLQCLTCTKPLTIFFLRRSHSRACCTKDWCLICELEQHVAMLREIGGPLSPIRILSHMRSINRQIGEGSQEDAHEFLRLLITSMQSICLEGLGGENAVDPRLQETTFIQHTFGGRLRSKVKCLRCRHESERYENFMDLTLEIFGWVESLEDALTQFTAPEDLEGENMYKCGRCAAYVRARKQLSIHEAPNILTIVLKRFQEGNFGKINKCITFPDMLDMVPFMTGTEDIPPLYMLYAVVVHLDTLNASFSGHYISYVKDLQGNWFRIDDAEVRPVPISFVMSEGAYILFYMRSCPRPERAYSSKLTPAFMKHWTSKSQKPSRPRDGKSSCHYVDPLSDLRRLNRNRPPSMDEFSDATSSDWSLFTSSDESSSFTTESTRDSFSTIDYADAGNIDPISSIFNTIYRPEYAKDQSISCSMFSWSKPQTRFVSEGKGFVMDSYLSTQTLDRMQGGESPSDLAFLSDANYGLNVNYADNLGGFTSRTSSNCRP